MIAFALPYKQFLRNSGIIRYSEWEEITIKKIAIRYMNSAIFVDVLPLHAEITVIIIPRMESNNNANINANLAAIPTPSIKLFVKVKFDFLLVQLYLLP